MSVKFWLVYRTEDVAKNQTYINFYYQEAVKLGLECELKYIETITFGIRNNKPFVCYAGQEERPDFVIIRAIYPELNRQFECCGIPTWNNSEVSRICNNKASTYREMSMIDICVPDTTFVESRYLVDFLQTCPAGTIIKSVDGHGGAQVVQYQNNVHEIISLMNHSDVVCQPVIGHRHSDLRVYVIGKRIVAAVLRTAQNGFKANYSLGGSVSLYELSEKEKEIVQKITERFSFGLVGIDFIPNDDGTLVFNEIEDVVGARMLYQCSDINIVREYLKFIIQNL